MKNLFLLLGLTIFANQSQGAIIIGSLTPVISNSMDDHRNATYAFIGGMAVTTSVYVKGAIMLSKASGFYSSSRAIAVLVLDENESGMDQYAKLIAHKFPFLNDISVVTELAQIAADRASEQTLSAGEMKEIPLVASEISEILERSDLSQTQTQLVIHELQSKN
jgi:hypothetical protein